ncbi:MAG: flagellar hook-basal body complex protein FliE [Candidatus Eisenbacteria bacterium]
MDPIRLDGPLRLSMPTATPSADGLGSGGPSFGDMFKKVLTDTSDMETSSKDLIQSFLRGEPVELHQVMAASEEASISLELLVELRNKLTDAYRSVMNVQ